MIIHRLQKRKFELDLFNFYPLQSQAISLECAPIVIRHVQILSVPKGINNVNFK